MFGLARRIPAPFLPAGLEFGAHEGADVEPHAVVEVRRPSERLFVERPPADEEVVGRFALEDERQLPLEILGGGEAAVGAFLALALRCPLTVDPLAEVAVGKRLQRSPPFTGRSAEAVAVDERVEAVLETVPDVPDEGPVDGSACSVRRRTGRAATRSATWRAFLPSATAVCRSSCSFAARPLLAVGGGEQAPQAVGRRRFAGRGLKAHDAVRVGEAVKLPAPLNPLSRLGRQTQLRVQLRVQLRRPAVAEQARDGDLEHSGTRPERAIGRSISSSRPRPRNRKGGRGRATGWGRRNRVRGGRWGTWSAATLLPVGKVEGHLSLERRIRHIELSLRMKNSRTSEP